MKRFLPILTVFFPVSVLYLLGGLEFIERSWMDIQFRLSDRPARSGVVLVDIDPKSLRNLEAWPWPRGYHATVIEHLLEAGATRVGLDIDFSSRSVAEEDAELAKVLAASKARIVLPVFQQWSSVPGEPARRMKTEPLEEFALHATLGSINLRPESDGLVRRYHNRGYSSTRLVPAFAAALSGDRRPDLQSFYIDFGIDSRTIPRISYVDVLTGQFDPAIVKGRTVIVGGSAVELGDQIAVPVLATIPGPMLQALAFESLTQDRALERVDRTLTLLLVLALTVLASPLFASFSWRGGLFLTFGGWITTLALAGAAGRLTPLILDVSPWLLTFVGLYGSALIAKIDQQALGLLSQGMMIRKTESLMQHVVQNSFDTIVTFGEDGVIETFNRSAQRMFGYSAEEAIGKKVVDLVRPCGDETKTGLFAQATTGPVEALVKNREGRDFPVELVVTSIETEQEVKLVAVLRDITDRSRHEQQLRHQATHDPLTDLPNRALLQQRIRFALDAAGLREQGAVLLLDLDRFKEINDALGHHTGDLLLIEVAKRLEEPLDDSDTLSRLGGDEFAILLPLASLEMTLHKSWKLIEALRAPFHVEGLALQVETSLGIALFPDHGQDPSTLIQRADVAMYVAKRSRSGLAVYHPEQDFNHMRQLKMRGDLRRAIEGDELKLFYQPKVLARTDDIIGVEALVRWKHEEHGNIPPDEFIGLAEHCGLIRSLTQWVLRTALRQQAVWHSEGLTLNVSVNLSARNLLEEDLPLNLRGLLEMYRVPPELLTLEITESVIMEDPERALRIVTRLRDLGVGISVDDFGTGYSSLGYLMRLPAEELKIDKSFVMRMEEDAGSATIVHSTIDLAHNLGLKVVAEGVESEAIWRVLKELGCDIGQGFHFSRPLPAEQLRSFLAAHVSPSGEFAALLPALSALAPPGVDGSSAKRP